MLDKSNIPQHIAIIMDGNGRWARQRGLPRSAGHREGVKRVEEIVNVAAKSGVEVITFFAFSSENWDRPKKEIGILMRFLNDFLEKKISKLNKNNIKFKVIGRKEPLSEDILRKIKDAQDLTGQNNGITMVLALNYGSRNEILDAVRKFTSSVLSNKASIEQLSDEIFSGYLYTAGLPDPDLLIRTSGEERLSNFLLWQISYSELYFTEKFWPDFKAADFQEAICEYQKRERRFGKANV